VKVTAEFLNLRLRVYTPTGYVHFINESGGNDVALNLSGEGGHYEYLQLVKPSVAAVVRGTPFYISPTISDGDNAELDVASQVVVDAGGVGVGLGKDVTDAKDVEAELCGGQEEEGWQVVRGRKERKAVTFASPVASHVSSSPIVSRERKRLRMSEVLSAYKLSFKSDETE